MVIIYTIAVLIGLGLPMFVAVNCLLEEFNTQVSEPREIEFGKSLAMVRMRRLGVVDGDWREYTTYRMMAA